MILFHCTCHKRQSFVPLARIAHETCWEAMSAVERGRAVIQKQATPPNDELRLACKVATVNATVFVVG
jgi:hypothetical protein